MNKTKLTLTMLLLSLLIVTPVYAFFETPSNNILLCTNNIDVVNDGSVVYTDGNTTIVTNPFSYYKEGATLGQMEILLPYMPTGTDTNHINMEIEVSTKSDYLRRAKFIFDGVATSTGFTGSSITTAQYWTDSFEIIGSFQTIGLSTKTDRLQIDLGSSFFGASNFTDLRVTVNKVTITGDNVDEDWLNNWTLTLVNTPFTSPSRTMGSQYEYWNSENDGAGSGLDADKIGGYTYTNFPYGTNSRATTVTSNYSQPDDRVQFLTGNNPYDEPFESNVGNPWSSVININFANTGGVNWQLGMTSDQDRLGMRREYGSWYEWVELLTTKTGYYTPVNTNFTGNHTQNGNLDVTGIITSGNGWSGNCINVSVLNGIINGCND